MSLETDEPAPTGTTRERLHWHAERMWKFFNASRGLARAADEKRAWWQSQIGKRRDVHSVAEADTNCDKDPVYKGYISDQAMYDRWFMREAAAIQAITALVHYHDARPLSPSFAYEDDDNLSAERIDDDDIWMTTEGPFRRKPRPWPQHKTDRER